MRNSIEEHLARIETDGYTVVEDAIDRSTIDSLLADVARIVGIGLKQCRPAGPKRPVHVELDHGETKSPSPPGPIRTIRKNRCDFRIRGGYASVNANAQVPPVGEIPVQ